MPYSKLLPLKKASKVKKPPKILSKGELTKKAYKKLENELDGLWSQIIHERWGHKCGWPGCTYKTLRLSSHHWIHRAAGYKARWNLDNGILLDYFHHIHSVHQMGNTEPIRDALIERLGQDGFDKLKKDCTGVWKPTIDELEELRYMFRGELSKKLETDLAGAVQDMRMRGAL